ncbi:hypothetical protein N333_05101, partial [Nestor notabilis]
DTGHSSLRSKAGFHKGARVEHAQKPVDDDLEREIFISHLFALGRRRVKSVVGKIPSEDVQFARNYPPWIPKIQFILWRKKGFKLLGK